MSRMVNTVCGPVSSDKLGGVLSHEHFVFGWAGYQGDQSVYPFDKEAFLKKAGDICTRLKSYGIETVVDATPNDCGRDVFLLKELSERTEMNIICCTGYYYANQGAPAYFNFRKSNYDIVSEVEEIFEQELNVGINGSDIKAGVIKVCAAPFKMDDYDKVFLDAAGHVASRDNNVRIITHTTDGCGPEQAESLIAAGVKPRQIAIGHLDNALNVDYLLKVAEQGTYLSFDRFGLVAAYGCPTDERRVAALASMVAMGYEDKIIISHDTTIEFLGRPYKYPPEILAQLKNSHFEHISQNVTKILKNAKMSDQQIHKFLYENPASFHGE